MVKDRKLSSRTRYAAGSRRKFGVLLLGIALTVTYVWKKVELGEVARKIGTQRNRIEELGEERSRLLAAVDFKKKPGAIERIARGQLGMEYPAGRLSELSFDLGETAGAE